MPGGEDRRHQHAYAESDIDGMLHNEAGFHHV
jgi:hypothetical protein